MKEFEIKTTLQVDPAHFVDMDGNFDHTAWQAEVDKVSIACQSLSLEKGWDFDEDTETFTEYPINPETGEEEESIEYSFVYERIQGVIKINTYC